jgi:protein dithiol oxidoreductase (disulfide-forming)
MKRLMWNCVLVLAFAASSACGNKQAPEQSVAAPAPQSAPAAASDSPPPAAEEAAVPATSAEAAAEPAVPTEQLSETADTEEPVDTASTGTQPQLRLGGPAPAPASRQFQEGVQYKKVVPAQRTSVAPNKVEIMEVFWYGCGHCYALDPAIESWRKSKPEYVEFVRVPVMWGAVHKLHARMFYTAELLGKLDSLHMQLFRAIHNEGNMLDTEEKIQTFFTSHGVSEADFKRTFSSFAVENKLKRAEFLGRAYRIDAVPMFAINGKYTTGVGDAGGEQQLFGVLNEVAAAEHGG